ncbi:hypothetical protein TWF696_003046 [Orbilia brochopaga]|uniref:Uncharacterized protein n=1 Tax=Orbilia brochopaga TaxID=3140254 RepID=A0AAV9U1K5_9PEZI
MARRRVQGSEKRPRSSSDEEEEQRPQKRVKTAGSASSAESLGSTGGPGLNIGDTEYPETETTGDRYYPTTVGSGSSGPEGTDEGRSLASSELSELLEAADNGSDPSDGGEPPAPMFAIPRLPQGDAECPGSPLTVSSHGTGVSDISFEGRGARLGASLFNREGTPATVFSGPVVPDYPTFPPIDLSTMPLIGFTSRVFRRELERTIR